jgi:hypothetical protein
VVASVERAILAPAREIVEQGRARRRARLRQSRNPGARPSRAKAPSRNRVRRRHLGVTAYPDMADRMSPEHATGCFGMRNRPWPKPLNSTAAGKVRGSFRAICVCRRAKRATSPATGLLFWESTGLRKPPASQLDSVAINA